MNKLSIKTMQDKKNKLYCESILSELEKYIEGQMYKCCKCGEVFESYEKICKECKKEINIFGYMDKEKNYKELDEQLLIYDFFEGGIFETEFILNDKKEYKSISLKIAHGNPDIYIDTKDKKIKLYNMSSYFEYFIPNNICDAIDDFGRELYYC